VVEKFKWIEIGKGTANVWCCVIRIYGESDMNFKEYRLEAYTAPHAICFTALKAVEGNRGE